jgi:hypothetical protein
LQKPIKIQFHVIAVTRSGETIILVRNNGHKQTFPTKLLPSRKSFAALYFAIYPEQNIDVFTVMAQV